MSAVKDRSNGRGYSAMSRYPFPWEPLSRWNWRYWLLKQRWVSGDEIYNPLSYQTDLQRARQGIDEIMLIRLTHTNAETYYI